MSDLADSAASFVLATANPHSQAGQDAPSNHDVLIDFLDSLGVEDAANVAHYLLANYRTLPELLHATHWRLSKLVGPELARVIRSTRRLLETAHLERAAQQPVLAGGEAMMAFVQMHLGHLVAERLSVVFVDGFCRLLRVQTIAEGGPDEVSLKAATVLRWALDAGASGFLLVHNHPSGDVRPSESDRSLTHLLEMLAAGLDMTMLGHLIVARGQISKIEGNGARIRSS